MLANACYGCGTECSAGGVCYRIDSGLIYGYLPLTPLLSSLMRALASEESTFAFVRFEWAQQIGRLRNVTRIVLESSNIAASFRPY